MFNEIKEEIMGKRIGYSVIIPAYNEEKYIAACLNAINKAIESLPLIQAEVIVVDNQSTDKTAKIAKDLGAKVVYEPHRQIAKVRNTGASVAKGGYLIFIDADTVISTKLLQQTIMCLNSGRVIGGGAQVVPDNSRYRSVNGSIKVWRFLSSKRRWAAGCYLFCLKKAYDEIGGFDEQYYAAEEIVFSKALKKLAKLWQLKMVILTTPVMTSIRKFEWFGIWRLLWQGFLVMLMPSRLKRRKSLPVWYKRPNH